MKELLLTIDVKCLEPLCIDGKNQKVVMVPFTGVAKGEFFNGEVLGNGVDTQRYKKDGTSSLSARYMIEGTDYKGEKCRLFIENNVNGDSWVPTITTDSQNLKEWEDDKLCSTVEGAAEGVTVKIFKIS